MTPADLARWLDGYRDAWVTRDPDRAAELFAEDALYRKHPMAEIHRGREAVRQYWQEITRPQSDVDLRYGRPLLADGRAAVEWWVQLRRDGNPVTIAGEFLLVFDTEGRCRDLREYWNAAEGMHEPAPGWGL